MLHQFFGRLALTFFVSISLTACTQKELQDSLLASVYETGQSYACNHSQEGIDRDSRRTNCLRPAEGGQRISYRKFQDQRKAALALDASDGKAPTDPEKIDEIFVERYMTPQASSE